jgi:hypothetical protein
LRCNVAPARRVKRLKVSDIGFLHRAHLFSFTVDF